MPPHMQVIPHEQVTPLVVTPESSVVISPLRLMYRQRVQAAVPVKSCSWTKAPLLAMPTAYPSRLKVTAERLFDTKVSVLEKVFCHRRTVSPGSRTPVSVGSENTIQPLCHVVALATQLCPSVDMQTVTFRPSLTASARANCRSPSRPFTSPAMRLEFVT